jgi:type I restriction enzyme S subunit
MDWKSTFVLAPDKKSFDLTYTKCGLCELGKREECFHLIKYMCKTDFVTFEYMGAKLTRNHTLANGDSLCDFHVTKTEESK